MFLEFVVAVKLFGTELALTSLDPSRLVLARVTHVPVENQLGLIWEVVVAGLAGEPLLQVQRYQLLGQ